MNRATAALAALLACSAPAFAEGDPEHLFCAFKQTAAGKAPITYEFAPFSEELMAEVAFQAGDRYLAAPAGKRPPWRVVSNPVTMNLVSVRDAGWSISMSARSEVKGAKTAPAILANGSRVVGNGRCSWLTRDQFEAIVGGGSAPRSNAPEVGI